MCDDEKTLLNPELNHTCGECKYYWRCEMFIAEDNPFASKCALFIRKKDDNENI